MYLVWLLIPKSKLRTPFADAEKAYQSAKETWNSEYMGIHFAISTVIAYRFPSLDDIFNEALEYSKIKNPLVPAPEDFKTFRDAAEWTFWWIRKHKNQ